MIGAAGTSAGRGHLVAAVCLAAAFALAYLPDVGHGFVKDDFAWIVNGRLDEPGSLRRVLTGSVGFYRPVVMLSFGVNHALFGTWSLGYGLTNVVLALACAGLLFVLARALGLTSRAALLAAGLWAFNFHGINMAVLWLSGRTSLWLTLWSLALALAVVRRRAALAFLFALLALLSKEEAVALPAIAFALAAIDRAGRPSPGWIARGLRGAVPPLAALVVYLGLRLPSGAYTPQTAPAFYRLGLEPLAAVQNVLHYADRSSTLAVAVLLLLALHLRTRPRAGAHGPVILIGLVWLAAGFALTVWLPVRSSLYAVFPSVGVVLAAAALAEDLFARADQVRVRRAVAVLIALPFLLLPVYWARNVRWVELADLSRATFAAIRAEEASLAPGTLIELRDDLSTRASFHNTFGALYPEAARVYFGDRYRLWIEPPPPDAAGATRPEAAAVAAFRLGGGWIVRAR